MTPFRSHSSTRLNWDPYKCSQLQQVCAEGSIARILWDCMHVLFKYKMHPNQIDFLAGSGIHLQVCSHQRFSCNGYAAASEWSSMQASLAAAQEIYPHLSIALEAFIGFSGS